MQRVRAPDGEPSSSSAQSRAFAPVVCLRFRRGGRGLRSLLDREALSCQFDAPLIACLVWCTPDLRNRSWHERYISYRMLRAPGDFWETMRPLAMDRVHSLSRPVNVVDASMGPFIESAIRGVPRALPILVFRGGGKQATHDSPCQLACSSFLSMRNLGPQPPDDGVRPFIASDQGSNSVWRAVPVGHRMGTYLFISSSCKWRLCSYIPKSRSLSPNLKKSWIGLRQSQHARATPIISHQTDLRIGSFTWNSFIQVKAVPDAISCPRCQCGSSRWTCAKS